MLSYDISSFYRDKEYDIVVEADKSNEVDHQDVNVSSDLELCDEQPAIKVSLNSHPLDKYACETNECSLAKHLIHFVL